MRMETNVLWWSLGGLTDGNSPTLNPSGHVVGSFSLSSRLTWMLYPVGVCHSQGHTRTQPREPQAWETQVFYNGLEPTCPNFVLKGHTIFFCLFFEWDIVAL